VGALRSTAQTAAANAATDPKIPIARILIRSLIGRFGSILNPQLGR
jgi:hypothetical protein